MAEILAPGFDFFRAAAMRIGEVGQHVPKTVRCERKKIRIHECCLEDLAYPRGAGPELPAYAVGYETVIGVQADQGFREEGIVIAE